MKCPKCNQEIPNPQLHVCTVWEPGTMMGDIEQNIRLDNIEKAIKDESNPLLRYLRKETL
jgi:hypothetical protein